MTEQPSESSAAYAFALTAGEAEAVAARFGLRSALNGGLTLSHLAPLAAFVLVMLFASVLALAGFVSRRAGEAAILIAAAAFMIQRLTTHWRIRAARVRAKTALSAAAAEQTIRFEDGGVTQSEAGGVRQLAYPDIAEVEDAGGMIYLWPRHGAPVALPTRILCEGEPQRLVKSVQRRIEAGGRPELPVRAEF